jgi:hypothetical protein
MRIVTGVLLMAFGFTATGCMVVDRRSRALVGPSRSPTCHPSQYWDGHQCRHKGKGHGARKHDGDRGKGRK